MTGAITWEQLAFFVVLIAALGGLWYRVETRISRGTKDAMSEASQAQHDLAEFKLEVARGYPSIGLLKEVENRVLVRLDGLVNELHGMRQDMQEALVALAKVSSVMITGDRPKGRGK